MKTDILEMPKIDTKKAEVALTEANAVLTQARQIVIKTAEQAQLAGDWRNKIKTKLKELDTERKELTRPLDEVKAKIMDKYRPAIDALNSAYQLFDKGLTGYLAEQEHIRQEQQRKLEAEAEKKRKEAEAKAQQFTEKGNEKKAQEWLERAETIVAPVIETAPPKVEGIATRKDWDIEIISPNIVPREFCIPDEKAIRGYVKATKGTMEIPGVKIIPKTIIVKND